MKNKTFIAFIIIAVSSSLFAQTKSGDEQIPDLASDESMKSAKTPRPAFVPSYGGWIMPVYMSDSRSSYTDAETRAELSSYSVTSKLWASLSLGSSNYIYVRGKDVFSREISSKNYNDDADYNNLDLDAAFADVGSSNRNFRLIAGRRNFAAGSGTVLNGRGDGAEFDASYRYFDAQVFSFYTGLVKKDSNPYGLSSRDLSDGAKRLFGGGSVSFSYMNNSVYALGVFQKDKGKEDEGVKTRYDSRYYGLGVKGSPVDMIDYSAEGIFETGKSYTAAGDKKNISAYAAVVTMNAYFDAGAKPSLFLQYAFGSGDGDRSYAATSPNGNGRGNDKNFISFGTYNGGYAFRPRLSNIHVFRLGGGVVPFASASSPRFSRLYLYFRLNYYLKDKASAPVNDGEGTLAERNLGQGLDLSFRWKVFSDLSFFAQYGAFVPGSAYSADERTRQSIMAGSLIEF
jgi:hypothetical protein